MEQMGADKKGISNGAVRLGTDMTIFAIDEIKDQLSAELNSSYRLELDLSAVEEIDSTGIQLLLALRAELIRKNREFRLIAISHVVAELFRNFDITDRFNIGETP